MSFPAKVRIVEVSPRDGLQNEARTIPVATRIAFIEKLADSGLKAVEAGALVSPKSIPQMADSAEVLRGLSRHEGMSYPVLVPNLRGFEAALAVGATEVAVFTAASETFSQRNVNCSIAESFERFAPVFEFAQRMNVRVRGYVSCALGCPFEGAMTPARVAEVAARLYESGCYEISLGDTIGVGTPKRAQEVVNAVAERVPVDHLAGHFHDTYGQALANIYASLEMGIQVFDASVSGLGGCPFVPGAAGNVATEDLVYMLDGMDIATGVDLDGLMDAGAFICGVLGRDTRSRVARVKRASRA